MDTSILWRIYLWKIRQVITKFSYLSTKVKNTQYKLLLENCTLEKKQQQQNPFVDSVVYYNVVYKSINVNLFAPT